MRILFIGTVQFSEDTLRHTIRLKKDVVGVIAKKQSAFNTDFRDLSKVAKANNIPYRYAKKINTKNTVRWIKEKMPDVIFCFGWSKLLDKEILNIPKIGVIGFHPAKLPINRGRHPIVWALALGLKKTASTFFLMDKNADSGRVLSQSDLKIDYEDNAETLYKKITKRALKQIKSFIPKLERGTYRTITQKDSRANYWRKRNEDDGKIDFRMTSRSIYNLVRALSKPYCGAYVVYKKKNIKIWDAKEINNNKLNTEYGKVISVSRKMLTVKCEGGAIQLKKHEFKKIPKAGEYLI